MNEFLHLFGFGLALLPTITLGIQTEVGDSEAGKTKEQMALDALAIAMQGAASVLPAGSPESTLATEAGTLAAIGIDITGNVAKVLGHIKSTNAVTTAVNFNKQTGAHQAATAAFTAANVTPVTPAAAPETTPPVTPETTLG